MPKYDAFGREIGEDTLSGWRTGESADAVPAEPVEPPQPEPALTASAHESMPPRM